LDNGHVTPPVKPPSHLTRVPLPPGADLRSLESRYGRRHSPRVAALVVALVAVPFVGWVIWAGAEQADQDLRFTTVGFSDVSDTSVRIRFDVFLPSGATAICSVRALDQSGVEVGRATVPVEATGDNVSVVYALPVTARPSSAFVETCRLDN
jgi:hypothetical protein